MERQTYHFKRNEKHPLISYIIVIVQELGCIEWNTATINYAVNDKIPRIFTLECVLSGMSFESNKSVNVHFLQTTWKHHHFLGILHILFHSKRIIFEQSEMKNIFQKKKLHRNKSKRGKCCDSCGGKKLMGWQLVFVQV